MINFIGTLITLIDNYLIDPFVQRILVRIDEYLIDPFVQSILVMTNSSENVTKLKEKVRQLEIASKDKQRELVEAENAGQVSTETARRWFEDVKQIVEEATAIEESYHLDQRTCACGFCVNCYSVYELSKKSVKLGEAADEMLSRQSFEVARRRIENQPSTQQMLHRIMECIDSPRFEVIRVFGQGGVGKTTLAKEVNNHFIKEKSSFETVIMVTVSAIPNTRDIRITIGKGLGLDLSNDSEADAKERLSNALSKKKFLLILDNAGDENKVKLNDIGIFRPDQDHERSSKILLIGRSPDASENMNADITIKVQPLPRGESWNLFVELAGQHVADNDRIRSLAEKIVLRCEGLPLGIVAVAQAMSTQWDVEEWEKAVTDIEKLAANLQGTQEETLVPLKFCFDRLKDDIVRSLFLYCACFPGGSNIGKRQILDFCVGEGLVDGSGRLIDASIEGEDLIRNLKKSSMLENGEVEDSVRMHEKMRQLAQWITSSESSKWSKFLICTGKSFKEAPYANQWLDATRISLMDAQIEELPELRERCRKLTTLLLSHSRILTVPTRDFLSSLPNLRILDLSDTLTLKYLPDSFSPLVNLRVLRLRDCPFLNKLPELGMLEHLQILDLRNCKFSEQQILGSKFLGGGRNLRYLDVSSTNVSILPGVISPVLKLVEVLNLHEAHNIKWRVMLSGENQSNSHSNGRSEGQNMVAENNVIDVGELSKLTHLTSLGISFQSMNISDWFIPLAQKITDLELNSCKVVEVAIRALNGSHNLQQLKFESCQGLKWVPTCVEGKLEIDKCEDLEKVLDGAEVEPNQDSFQRLNVLCLRWLEKLERICVGPAPPNSFGNLRKLTIMHCHRLKMVFTKKMFFTKGMPRLFNNLESIVVNHCNGMEVIIEGVERRASKNNVISSFPKLKILHLFELPVLAHVCRNSILQCPHLKYMTAHKCPGLRKDPLNISIADELLVIKNEETGQWEGDFLEQEIQD